MGGLFTLYIWSCLDTWAWDHSPVSHSFREASVSCNVATRVLEWTTSPPNDYSVGSVTCSHAFDVLWLPVTMATVHWSNQTSLHLLQGWLNHSSTFIATEFHHFLQTRTSELPWLCTLQAPGWDWVSSLDRVSAALQTQINSYIQILSLQTFTKLSEAK